MTTLCIAFDFEDYFILGMTCTSGNSIYAEFVKPWMAVVITLFCSGVTIHAEIIQFSIRGNLQRISKSPLDMPSAWDSSIPPFGFPFHKIPYEIDLSYETSTSSRVPLQHDAKVTSAMWNLGSGSSARLSFGDYSLQVRDLTTTITKLNKSPVAVVFFSGMSNLPNGHRFWFNIMLNSNAPSDQLELSDIQNFVFSDPTGLRTVIDVQTDNELFGFIEPFKLTKLTSSSGLLALQSFVAKETGVAPDSYVSTTQVSGASTSSMFSPPIIGTNLVIDAGVNGAMVSLDLTPNGSQTSYYFEYGLTTEYGLRTPLETAGDGSSAVNVQVEFAGLTPNTFYHFRIVVVSVAGTFYGPDETFTTLPNNSFD